MNGTLVEGVADRAGLGRPLVKRPDPTHFITMVREKLTNVVTC
jgi:hypothetical protein